MFKSCFVHQEALALISEYSEAGITVRGTYVPPGKAPPEGERKLYLAIESSQELAVAKAKSEITRLIKEELLKLQTSAHHMINKARYKVLWLNDYILWRFVYRVFHFRLDGIISTLEYIFMHVYVCI